MVFLSFTRLFFSHHPMTFKEINAHAAAGGDPKSTMIRAEVTELLLL
jgi:hypothetical protein